MTISGPARPLRPPDSQRPTVAIVSGRPGSGKSTLARKLADTLSCPMVSRDEINEGIRYTLDGRADPASKDRVAKLTFDAFFRVLGVLASCDVTFVAEAAFQDPRWRIGLEPLLPVADFKVIHCIVDPQVAHQRVVRRILARQAGGPLERTLADLHARDPGQLTVRPFEPLSLPIPSLTVSTAEGYDPQLETIAAFVAST